MTRRPWLAPVVLVAIAVVLAATMGGLARRRASFAVPGVPLGIGGLMVPTVVPNATSVSWYCDLVPEVNGVAHEAVLLENPSSHTRRFELLAHADGHATHGVLLAHSNLRVPMTGPGGTMVLSSGGVLVMTEATLASGTSLVPCASSPGTSWTVGGLGTLTGDTSVLSIYNPLGRQAVVDVVGYSESGTITVPSVQGLIVQPGKVLELNAERFAPDAAMTAATVVAKDGAVVVSASVALAGTPPTVAIELGAMTPSGRQYFPYVSDSAHRHLELQLVNPGGQALTARVLVAPFTGTSPPATMHRMRQVLRIPVPAGSSFAVDIAPEAAAIGAPAFALKVTTSSVGLVATLLEAGGPGAGALRTPYPFPSALWWLACVGTVPHGGPSVVFTRGATTGVIVDVVGQSLSGVPRLTQSSSNVLEPSISGVGMSLPTPGLYEIAASTRMTIAPTEVGEACVSVPAT